MNVYLIAAVSADGYIARDPSQISTSWTSTEDKKFFSERTKQSGVVVMGKRTFETIGKALPGRRTIVYSETPITGIETTTLPPRELVEKLESESVRELAVCGGASVYTMFAEAGLLDTIYLTIEPILFGSGICLFTKPLDLSLELVSVKNLSPQTLFLEYHVRSGTSDIR
jgi:dihydrofolate reductase